MTHTCQFAPCGHDEEHLCGIKTELFIMVGPYKLWLCTYHHDVVEDARSETPRPVPVTRLLQ